MIGTVQEFGRSQKGNPKIKIDGKWYPVGRNNTDGIQPGSQVEVEYGSFRGNDGKDVACISSIRPSAAPRNAPNLPPFDEAELRFISNVVGSAITGGKVERPEEVSLWARAAANALKALKSFGGELDDEMPESFYRNENPAPQEYQNNPSQRAPSW